MQVRPRVSGYVDAVRFEAGEQPRILSVVAGGLTMAGAASGPRLLPRGENVLLPWSADLEFGAPEPAIVLVTEDFT